MMASMRANVGELLGEGGARRRHARRTLHAFGGREVLEYHPRPADRQLVLCETLPALRHGPLGPLDRGGEEPGHVLGCGQVDPRRLDRVEVGAAVGEGAELSAGLFRLGLGLPLAFTLGVALGRGLRQCRRWRAPRR